MTGARGAAPVTSRVCFALDKSGCAGGELKLPKGSLLLERERLLLLLRGGSSSGRWLELLLEGAELLDLLELE